MIRLLVVAALAACGAPPQPVSSVAPEPSPATTPGLDLTESLALGMVDRDRAELHKLGVDRLPVAFVAGKRVYPRAKPELRAAIDDGLR